MYPWKLSSIRSHSKHPQGMYSMKYRTPDSWFFRAYRIWSGKRDDKFREWARLWLSGCFSNLASAKAQIQFFIFKRQARRNLNEKTVLHPFLGFYRAILKKLLPRESAQKLTPTTHGDRAFFKSTMHITVRLRRTVICNFFGWRFLIVSPLFLPEHPRAFYQFGRLGKRGCAEGASDIFAKCCAVANYLGLCTALLGKSQTISERHLPTIFNHPALVFHKPGLRWPDSHAKWGVC